MTRPPPWNRRIRRLRLWVAEAVGENIAITQGKMARMLGLTRQHVSRLERDYCPPSPTTKLLIEALEREHGPRE